MTRGERFQKFRILAGHTQDSLAEASGISRVTISAIERDETVPRTSTAEKILAACGVTIDDLYDAPKEISSRWGASRPVHEALQDVIDRGGKLSDALVTIVEAVSKASRIELKLQGIPSEEKTGTPVIVQIPKKIEQAIPKEAADSAGKAESAQASDSPGKVVPFDNNIDEMREIVEVYVPLWDYAAASAPDGSDPEFLGYWPVVHSQRKETWRAIRLKGDSMEPDFWDGDIVLVDVAKQPIKGKPVVADIIGQGGTFKIYGGIDRKTKMIKLLPRNPSHKVIELPADQVKIKASYVETIRAKR